MLPAELQLLILCKCDLASIGRLLELSPYVKRLFLRYPETALRDILGQLSGPLASLLRVSWALHSLSDDVFDSEKILHLLRSMDLLDWALAYQRILADHDDPLDVVQGLIKLYVDVDVAVGLVAQGMHAAMEAFVNPHVVVAPLVLSATEHTRIACSLYIVKIYYQLRAKFMHDGHDWTSEFPAAFMRSLKPWQAGQAVSVEKFLGAVEQLYDFSVYNLIDKRYTCKECLSEKSQYFRDYAMVTNTVAGPQGLTRAAMDLRHIRPPQVPGRREPNDQGHPSRALVTTTQLRNDGWMMYESLADNGWHRRYHLHHPLTSLGFLFWDQGRLTNWDLANLDDVSFAYEAFQHRFELETANLHRERRTEQLYWLTPASSERKKARQIVQWTRSPVQCTLEESLYQKTALMRIAKGRPPLPSKYIEPGMVCHICWLDGHRGTRCTEENWSDDDEPQESKEL